MADLRIRDVAGAVRGMSAARAQRVGTSLEAWLPEPVPRQVGRHGNAALARPFENRPDGTDEAMNQAAAEIERARWDMRVGASVGALKRAWTSDTC